MPVLKTSQALLAERALKKAVRRDIGQTATWHIEENGPRILFVHGFRGDHHGLMSIAGAINDSSVVVPDLPGYGKSAELAGEHNLDNYGQWLVDFVAQAGGFDLVLGHSFGTLVVSSAHSKGLGIPTVLLNPITSRASEIGGLGQVLAQRYYDFGEKRPSALANPAIVRGMSMLLTKSMDPRVRSFIHAQHASYFSSYNSPRVVLEGFKAASTGSVLDYQNELPDDLLLIAGERDLVAPLARTVELFESKPNSQLEVIPKVGHLTHYETPVEVARLVERFVTR